VERETLRIDPQTLDIISDTSRQQQHFATFHGTGMFVDQSGLRRAQGTQNETLTLPQDPICNPSYVSRYVCS
jgi:hypothetical protein